MATCGPKVYVSRLTEIECNAIERNFERSIDAGVKYRNISIWLLQHQNNVRLKFV